MAEKEPATSVVYVVLAYGVYSRVTPVLHVNITCGAVDLSSLSSVYETCLSEFLGRGASKGPGVRLTCVGPEPVLVTVGVASLCYSITVYALFNGAVTLHNTNPDYWSCHRHGKDLV